MNNLKKIKPDLQKGVWLWLCFFFLSCIIALTKSSLRLYMHQNTFDTFKLLDCKKALRNSGKSDLMGVDQNFPLFWDLNKQLSLVRWQIVDCWLPVTKSKCASQSSGALLEWHRTPFTLHSRWKISKSQRHLTPHKQLFKFLRRCTSVLDNMGFSCSLKGASENCHA